MRRLKAGRVDGVRGWRVRFEGLLGELGKVGAGERLGKVGVDEWASGRADGVVVCLVVAAEEGRRRERARKTREGGEVVVGGLLREESSIGGER